MRVLIKVVCTKLFHYLLTHIFRFSFLYFIGLEYIGSIILICIKFRIYYYKFFQMLSTENRIIQSINI